MSDQHIHADDLGDLCDGAELREIFRGATAGTHVTGERRLLVAILELTIADLTGKRSRRAKHGREAMDWLTIAREDTRFPDIKSLEGVCEMLGLDVDHVRRLVLALQPTERRARELSHAKDRDEGYTGRRRARIVPREVA